MKNIFKIILFLIFCSFCFISITACTTNVSANNHKNAVGIPNPWSDCGNDLSKAAKIAGFKLPLVLSNFDVSAMKSMIEVNYPLDDKRKLTVRKSILSGNNGDISGDYGVYSESQQITMSNGRPVTVRKSNNMVYVLYFSHKKYFYSLNCLDGMTLDEAQKAYGVLAEVEKL